MDAWVYQELDWKTFGWHKEPDERGTTVGGATLNQCRLQHLDPLQ